MLGKTNITTLAESGIVTEIEDYRWVQMESGVYSDFVKTVYEGGYLVAITADGRVVYTVDGEVWQAADLVYPGCKINDVDWDGSRFILVGSYVDAGIDAEDSTALAVLTSDFKTFDKLPMIAWGTYSGEPCYYNDFIFAIPMNGKYAVAARYGEASLSGVLTEFVSGEIPAKLSMGGSFPLQHYAIAKNSSGALVYIYTCKVNPSGTTSFHGLYTVMDDAIKILKSYSSPNVRAIAPFECKDVLYFQHLRAEENYGLSKVTGAGEVMAVTTGQDFAFTDAVYFNECQLFINAHEMLVVRKGESLSDKTVDDLIEIAPELTMQCITKAFGQLYIFGNRGLILKSSVETDNEEVIAVQTLSAKRALAEAKAYTDTRYEELAARIEALGG